MKNAIFYQPPLAVSRQPRHLFELPKVGLLLLVIALLAGLPGASAQTGQRISIHTLFQSEQEELAKLINDWLNENMDIVEEHKNCFAEGIHSTNNFLPWHRIHIRELEDYIREHADASDFTAHIPNINDESFRLPYWRPEDIPPTGDKIPTAFQVTADPVTYPINTPQSNMNFNPDPAAFPIMGQFLSRLSNCQNLADAGFFSDILEAQYHDNGHSIMGGRINENEAPVCLIFWPWHAWVDDLWYYWENNCQGEYDFPFGTGDIITQNFTEIQAPGTSWSSELFVKGEIRIKNGATLTIGQNAVIHFRESSYNGFPTRIVVEPGGTLIVDGATLTGIDVFGDVSNAGDDPGSKY
ncbi:MAG TPA: tyrosinase family protein, partial [Saprospiraceae bacterium]|nr:tyrosinase family protein [Saprospiraceae bacterium]